MYRYNLYKSYSFYRDMVKEALKTLTGKENIYLVDSGKGAIVQAIDRCYEADSLGLRFMNKILVPDQGGWQIFRSKKDSFENVNLKTTYGVVWLTKLRQLADESTVVLLSSLAGYFAEQPMKEIMEICKAKNALVINDVSGSIGRTMAQHGDIIVGSFGKHKPLGIGYGGFIASDEKLNIQENFDVNRLVDLKDKLSDLTENATKIYKRSMQIKNDLKDYDILHRESNFLVVVVKYRSFFEKKEILKYCEDNKLHYLMCPKYIRVKEKAISIEVKKWD